MNTKNLKTLALGAAIAGSLAAMSTAQANPFAVTALASAYMAGDGDTKGTEGKCGEGKCGGSMAKKPAKPAAAKATEGQCGMAQMDSDKDGRISRAEFAAAHKDKAAEFDGIDADHDGYITQAEMDAHHAAMKKAGGEGGCGANMHGKTAGKN